MTDQNGRLSQSPRQLTGRVRHLLAQRHRSGVAPGAGRARAAARFRRVAQAPRVGPEPYVTARVPGRLRGVVTLARSTPSPLVRVSATWHECDMHISVTVERDDEADALATANRWIDLLADGFPPEVDD